MWREISGSRHAGRSFHQRTRTAVTGHSEEGTVIAKQAREVRVARCGAFTDHGEVSKLHPRSNGKPLMVII